MIALLLLLACRASDASDHMGERFTAGAEQPPNIAEGWRCDVWRGIMDRPQGIVCYEAHGPPEEPTEEAGRTYYRLMFGPPWYPPGLADGWTCAEWRIADAYYEAGCYPLAID